MKNKKENPNSIWYYENKPITSVSDFPSGAIGFIYRIDNLTKNKWYFGRKTCLSKCKKKLTVAEKSLPENFRKTWKITEKESPWQKYCGSSKELLADIKAGDKIHKTILQFCFSKAEMTFYETRAIICNDCLLDENCYNFWVSCKVYKKYLIK